MTLKQKQYRVIAVSLALVAASGLIGILSAKVDLLYVGILLGGILGILGIIFLLNHLEHSPIAILVIAAVIPFSLPTGTSSRIVFSLVASVLICGLWFLKMLVRDKKFHFVRSTINIPLFGFIFTTLISLGWSIAFRDSIVTVWNSFLFVQFAATLVMVLLPAILLLVANTVATMNSIKVIVIVFLITGFGGLIGNYLSLTSSSIQLPFETRGLTALWIVSFSTALLVYGKTISVIPKIMLAVLALGWIYWGFGLNNSWLAGWLPVFVAIGILGVMRSFKTGVIVGAILAIIVVNYYISTQALNNEIQTSGLTRLASWSINWRITGDHLLFGTGPAGYAAYYMYYFPNTAMATHNNYLDILAQTGIIGLLFCIWLFGVTAWRGYLLCRKLRGMGNFQEAVANALFAGTIGCIVMMFFGDWLFPFAYTQTISGFNYAVYSWIFMGLIFTLERSSATCSKHHDIDISKNAKQYTKVPEQA